MYPYSSHTALHHWMCHLPLLFILTAIDTVSFASISHNVVKAHSSVLFPLHFSSFRAVLGASSSSEVNEEIPGLEVMGVTELRLLETTAH
jgi:hypothetical protein